MTWPSQCVAVIPCLNEARSIAPIIRQVRRHLPSIVVVDDGSSDSTAGLAKAAGAEVVCHPSTQGKGAALQSGWRLALSRGFTWALSLDGDGQHDPDEIPRFLLCAQQTGASLVVGNRMVHSSAMPIVRRLVNRRMSRWISRVAGRDLPDSQCGFRLMDLKRWAGLPIATTHFEIESEVLLAFVLAGLRVEFVPIRAIYKQEQSKIHPLRDTIRWFSWWARARKTPRRTDVKS